MVGHSVILRGASLTNSALLGTVTPPTILLRTDREFIPAILDGLQSDSGRQALAATEIDARAQINGVNVRDSDQVLKLFQPVHQIFNVAIVQAMCDTFGNPRLDPRKIESCGLVIRRVSDSDPSLLERWSKYGDTLQGWVPCVDDDLDPDPSRRRPPATTGNSYIDNWLPIASPPYGPFTETVAPLFVAPPSVCVAAKVTILYGIVPVTSVEKSEAKPVIPFNSDFVRTHLPYFLRPKANRWNSSRWIGRANTNVTREDAADPRLATLITILKQFKFEFAAFDEDSSPGKAVFAALNQFTVQDAFGADIQNLGDFLKSAAGVLLDQQEGSVQLPARWPDIGTTDAAVIATLIQKAMEARLAALVGGERRYEAEGRFYRLRAFVRVKHDLAGCPPIIKWTPYSEPFSIAAWHENAGLPPIKITLPNIDGDFLNKLKPNVAFVMPAQLFNILQKNPKETLKGNDSPGGGSVGIMWICSFSLPLITICAFLVLNIFLSLFDLFFQWLLFIRICLPIPVPKPPPPKPPPPKPGP